MGLNYVCYFCFYAKTVTLHFDSEYVSYNFIHFIFLSFLRVTSNWTSQLSGKAADVDSPSTLFESRQIHLITWLSFQWFPPAQPGNWQESTSIRPWSKGKGKVLPRTGHEGAEGKQMYSSTLPSTSALDRGWWSTPRPGRFIPRKDPVSLGGPQGRYGRVRKISLPTGIRSSDCPARSESLYRLSYPGLNHCLY